MNSFKNLAFCLCWVTLMISGEVLAEGGDKTRSNIIQSTLAGLEFNKVRLLVWTTTEHTDRLYDRAVKLFADEGLHPGNNILPKPEFMGQLNLVLKVVPTKGECSGGYEYRRTLRLTENVQPVRNSQITFPAETWSMGISIPVSSPNVPLEQLETDLDKLIFEFLRSYKLGNLSLDKEKVSGTEGFPQKRIVS